MKPEQKIQNKIIDFLEKKGLHYFRAKNSASYNPSTGRWLLPGKGFKKGVPDIVWIAPGGTFVGFEVKRPDGGRVSVEQVGFKQRTEALGAQYHIVTSVADVEEVLKSYTQPPPA